jgi:hypothetical protein
MRWLILTVLATFCFCEDVAKQEVDLNKLVRVKAYNNLPVEVTADGLRLAINGYAFTPRGQPVLTECEVPYWFYRPLTPALMARLNDTQRDFIRQFRQKADAWKEAYDPISKAQLRLNNLSKRREDLSKRLRELDGKNQPAAQGISNQINGMFKSINEASAALGKASTANGITETRTYADLRGYFFTGLMAAGLKLTVPMDVVDPRSGSGLKDAAK